MKTGDLTTIATGFQVRSRITAEDNGTHSIIQMRNICEKTGRIKDSGENVFYQVSPPVNKAERYELTVGDLLILTRGKYNPASIITDTQAGFVAAGQFLVLKVDKSKCLPEFLCWFLNEPKTQKYFAMNRRGTAIPLLSKETVQNCVIDLPSLEIQKKIIEIDSLTKREQELLKNLIGKRELLSRAVCNELLITKKK